MKSIRSKLIMVMLIIVLVPFIIFNLSNYYLINKGYQESIESNHVILAKSVSANVASYMNNYYKLTEEIANNKDIKNFSPVGPKKILEDSAKRNPDIELYFIQGVDGMQTSRSSGELGDRSEREWFKKISNDKNPFISESYFSLTGNIPVTSIFMPIFNEQNNFKGVIGTDLKLDALQQIVEDLKTEDGTIAYVIDSQGVVIAHPSEEQVLEQYNYINSEKSVLLKDASGNVIIDDSGNQKIEIQDIQVSEKLQDATEKSLKGESGYVEYKDSKGEDVVSAYAPIELPGISENWAIITVQSKSVAFAFVRNIIRNNLFLAVLLILVVIFLSYVLSKQVTAPLNILNNAFDEATGGNLSVLAKIKTGDEFGQVGNNFNIMMKNISNLVNDVKNATNTIQSNAHSLVEITGQTSIANNEVALTVEEIAQGAADQAQDTEFGATKIIELADQIEKVKESTTEMNLVAGKTSELSNRGMEVVEILKERTKENMEASSKLNKVILEMDKSSGEIGDITNTISQIAEQTNLLALNAAIEAARVGEAGRGFSVVADEIRKLAEESSSSASHIQQLIDGIQSQSKEAVHAVNETATVVNNQGIQVDNTEDIFNDIAKSIETLSKEMLVINEYAENMDNSKDEIVIIIEGLSAQSQETSAATEEVSASIEEQLATMEEINDFVNNLEMLSSDLALSISKLTNQ